MSRTGNAGENRVARELRDEGWVVASMRQSAGGGDLMAVGASGPVLTYCRRSGSDAPSCGLAACDNGCDEVEVVMPEVRLVEVKANRAGGAWSNFRRGDRDEMLTYAEAAGASAWLAHAPPGQPTRWYPSEEWPT